MALSKLFLLKFVIHLLAFAPVITAFFLAVNDEFGADPVKEIIHFTGIGALNLLVLTLLVSPLAKQFKASVISKCRRLLGLYALFYALLHVLSYWIFELQFDLTRIVSEIIKRPYISLGMVALMLIIALGITSIDRIKRAMGKRWQKLHNMIYLLLALVVIHFWWSVKSDYLEPFIYLLLALFLFYLRRLKFQRWLNRKK
jgi:sulfoxide reductase heme-binding subunit YedZ